MIQGAGLFLRRSLYAQQPPLIEPPGNNYAATPRPADQNLLQRPLPQRNSFERKSFDCKSMGRKSTETFSNSFTSLSTVFNFADFVSSLGKVSDDIAVFVNLIQRVQQDLDEALRLLLNHVVEDYYNSFPDRWKWIENVLSDTQKALNEIGVYVENVRVSGDDGGTAKMRQKFDWVLRNHQKLLSREQALTICHQSLMVAISNMREVEMGVGAKALQLQGVVPGMFEAPAQPWLQVDEGNVLRSPYSRQKWRLSHRNLSVPSITISEHDTEKLDDQSINSVPVELPGSTPDDLAHPDNLDLYFLPTQLPRQADQPSKRIDLHQIKPRRSLDQLTTSRSSFDKNSRPLSILREHTIKYMVNGEIPGRAPTAKVARRYRPRAVDVRNVRKPLEKHQSLPNELPYLPTQPSLITELSNWIIHDAYEKTPASISPSSPDLPTSPASCPSIIQRAASITAAVSITPRSAPVDERVSSRNHVHSASLPNIPMERSMASVIRRKPLKPGSQPQYDSAAVRNSPDSPRSHESHSYRPSLPAPPELDVKFDPAPAPSASPEPEISAHSPASIYTSGTIPISLDHTSPTSPIVAGSTAAGPALTRTTRKGRAGLSRITTGSSEATSTPVRELTSQSSTALVAEEEAGKDEGSQHRASLGYMSGALPVEEAAKADSAVEISDPGGPAQITSEEAKSVNSQAKRRRAQARRMQLAYGSD